MIQHTLDDIKYTLMTASDIESVRLKYNWDIHVYRYTNISEIIDKNNDRKPLTEFEMF